MPSSTLHQRCQALRRGNPSMGELRAFFADRDRYYKEIGAYGLSDYLELSPIDWPRKWLAPRDGVRTGRNVRQRRRAG
jgi:hypothetical protein